MCVFGRVSGGGAENERVLVQDLMFGLTTAVALALFRSKPLGVALMVVLGLGEALSL